MDATTARNLLVQIKEAQAKEAAHNAPKSFIGSLPAKPMDLSVDPRYAAIQSLHNTRLQSDAKRMIVQAMLLSGGLGAGIRAMTGARNAVSPAKRKATGRVVDMSVPYPEKQASSAGDAHATSKIGLSYFAPGMLLGAPLAAYGGWKGVDSYLNRQRKKKIDDELADAVSRYEQSLTGSYKRANDLDGVYQAYDSPGLQDKAMSTLGGMSESFQKTFPNVSGASKGLALTYALATAPLGYYIVNKAMKNNSKKELLRQSLAERARRQAKNQPSELYAVPTPFKPERS
jgi:hypothetical protein